MVSNPEGDSLRGNHRGWFLWAFPVNGLNPWFQSDAGFCPSTAYALYAHEGRHSVTTHVFQPMFEPEGIIISRHFQQMVSTKGFNPWFASLRCEKRISPVFEVVGTLANVYGQWSAGGGAARVRLPPREETTGARWWRNPFRTVQTPRNDMNPTPWNDMNPLVNTCKYQRTMVSSMVFKVVLDLCIHGPPQLTKARRKRGGFEGSVSL